MFKFERIFWVSIIFIILSVVWNYSKPIVVMSRLSALSQNCDIKESIKKKNDPKISEAEKKVIVQNFWVCVESQQGPIEKLFIEVPENFLEH